MGLTRKEYWYWLCNIHGIGMKKREALLAFCHDPEVLFGLGKNEMEGIAGISGRDLVQIISSRNEERIQKEYEQLQQKGIHFLTREDKEYPEKFKQLKDPPGCLYYKGGLPDLTKPVVSVVGARECSDYGAYYAREFAKELSDAGVQIVSGMARGIDCMAHTGALRADTPTFAVLGCGVDVCYPPEKYQLYETILAHGGVISEYKPGTQPNPGFFPMRNRLIAALADVILVMEAKEKSGSLITASIGLELGKDIFSLPGRIHDRNFAGCNELIKMGAGLLNSTEDVLDSLMQRYPFLACSFLKCNKKENLVLETEEKIVYSILGLQPKHLNEVIEETHLPVQKVMELVLSLQLKGYIGQKGQNYYVRI